MAWVIMEAEEEQESCHSELATGDVALRAAAITISLKTSTVFAVALLALALLFKLSPAILLQWVLLPNLAWVKARWLARLVHHHTVQAPMLLDLVLPSLLVHLANTAR